MFPGDESCVVSIKSGTGNKHTTAFESEAMLNSYVFLQEIKEEEIKCNNEVGRAYVKFSNLGAGLGGGFEETNDLKPMKYNETINGRDGKA